MIIQSRAPGRVIRLEQFLTLALNTNVFCRSFIFHWICLPFILLILVELPLCVIVTLS